MLLEAKHTLLAFISERSQSEARASTVYFALDVSTITSTVHLTRSEFPNSLSEALRSEQISERTQKGTGMWGATSSNVHGIFVK